LQLFYINYTQGDTDYQAGPFIHIDKLHSHITTLECDRSIRAIYMSDFRNPRRTLREVESPSVAL
jgi:hypothetical protein